MDIVALETVKRLQYLDKLNTYILFCFDDQEGYTLESSANFQIVKIPRAPSPIIEQCILPFLALKYKLDVLHSTGNTSPLFLHCKRLVTLHDIIYLEKRDDLKGGSLYQQIGKKYRRFIVPRIIRKAEGLVTVSQNEKRIILDRLPELTGRLTVIPNAVSMHFMPKPAETTLSVSLKYKLPNHPFIFFLGNTDPKKNTLNVLKAYHAYVKKHGSALKLVIADLSRAVTNRLIDKYNLDEIRDHVYITNYVKHEDMPDIYNQARLFLYPSLRESFGLPILESMACGTPVITSGNHAMPETAGNAAIFINPESPQSIADAIHRLNSNESLRKQLIESGQRRIQEFSWNQSVFNLIKIYQAVLEGGSIKTAIPNSKPGLNQKGQPVYTS